MERVRKLFRAQQQPAYAPVGADADAEEEEDAQSYTGVDEEDEEDQLVGELDAQFSWIEYCIFMLLGVAMLWAW